MVQWWVSSSSAELSLWLQPSLLVPLLISKVPHPGALWPPQHLQPPGKDSLGGQIKCAFSFCHCGRDPKGHIAPTTFSQLFPAHRDSRAAFLWSPQGLPLLPSPCQGPSPGLCAQQHPANSAHAPHTCALSGDETELGARAGLPRDLPAINPTSSRTTAL